MDSVLVLCHLKLLCVICGDFVLAQKIIQKMAHLLLMQCCKSLVFFFYCSTKERVYEFLKQLVI